MGDSEQKLLQTSINYFSTIIRIALTALVAPLHSVRKGHYYPCQGRFRNLPWKRDALKIGSPHADMNNVISHLMRIDAAEF